MFYAVDVRALTPYPRRLLSLSSSLSLLLLLLLLCGFTLLQLRPDVVRGYMAICYNSDAEAHLSGANNATQCTYLKQVSAVESIAI